MSKICRSPIEAMETVEAQPKDHTYKIVEREGGYFVYRDDMKTIKSIYYSPADLGKIIKENS